VSFGLFVLLAQDYVQLKTSSSGAAFVFVYGLTYFFSNWGANTTTFIIPSEAFPTRIRSTAHGLSAAAGKIGATVGACGGDGRQPLGCIRYHT
jgi:PHS family inorganic phosphate transporter-like MFS transporter